MEVSGMEEDRSWRTRTLLVGALIGALTGLGIAFAMVQRAEQRGEPVKLNTGEGVRLGMGVLGLIRQIGQLGGE
jgi:hypothetical protein